MCYASGMAQTARQREYQREYARRKAAENKAAGLCRCGRQPSPGNKVCDRCLAWNNKSRVKTRAEFKAAGKCQCGRAARPGLKTCGECGTRSLPSRKRLTLVERLAGGEPEAPCAGCGVVLVLRQLEADHIKPRSAGGADRTSNRQLLCRFCNMVKGDRPMEFLRGYLAADTEPVRGKKGRGMVECVLCGESLPRRCLQSRGRCAPCVSALTNLGVARRSG